jgi:hypothetical protein
MRFITCLLLALVFSLSAMQFAQSHTSLAQHTVWSQTAPVEPHDGMFISTNEHRAVYPAWFIRLQKECKHDCSLLRIVDEGSIDMEGKLHLKRGVSRKKFMTDLVILNLSFGEAEKRRGEETIKQLREQLQKVTPKSVDRSPYLLQQVKY